MKTFEIREGDEVLATIDADSPKDALAAYAVAEGFSDPRQFCGTDEDFFYELPDGRVGMVYLNFELDGVSRP